MNVSGTGCPLYTAVNGLTDSKNRINNNANEIANSTVSQKDVVPTLLDNKMALNQAGALLKVIKADDEMVGTLINIKV